MEEGFMLRCIDFQGETEGVDPSENQMRKSAREFIQRAPSSGCFSCDRSQRIDRACIRPRSRYH